MRPIQSVSRIVLIAAGLFLFSGCSLLQNRWEKVCVLRSGLETQYGQAMMVNGDGNVHLLSLHSNGESLMYDVHAKKFVSSQWPGIEYGEWVDRPQNDRGAQRDALPDIDTTLLYPQICTGLYSSILSKINLDGVIKSIDEYPDEEKNVLRYDASNKPWAQLSYSEKRASIEQLLRELTNSLSNMYTINFVDHESISYGLMQWSDYELHDVLDGDPWPDRMIESLNNLSSEPSIIFNSNIGNHPVIIADLYTVGDFRKTRSDTAAFIAEGDGGRPFLFTTIGVWVFSSKKKWTIPEHFPIQMNSSTSVKPAFFINQDFLYVFGDSKDGSGPAIYRLPVSRI